MQKLHRFCVGIILLFLSNAYAKDGVLSICNRSEIIFSDPVSKKERRLYESGWKKALVTTPSGAIINLLPQERLSKLGGTIFSELDYLRVSPSGKYVVLSIVRAGILGYDPRAKNSPSVSSRQYCPVLATETGCLLSNQTGQICGGQWDKEKDLWVVGLGDQIDEDTHAMIKLEFKAVREIWREFSGSQKSKITYKLSDRISDDLGVENLVACHPLNRENMDVYALIANQLKIEGQIHDGAFIERKLRKMGWRE